MTFSAGDAITWLHQPIRNHLGQYVPTDAHQRFWARGYQTGECWLWTGTCEPDGYGQFWFKGATVALIGSRGSSPMGQSRRVSGFSIVAITGVASVLSTCFLAPCRTTAPTWLPKVVKLRDLTPSTACSPTLSTAARSSSATATATPGCDPRITPSVSSNLSPCRIQTMTHATS
jgi:hypothetical protein